MKTSIFAIISLTLVAAAAGLAAAADKKVHMKDLPAAVQRTVQAEEAKGAKIVGLATEVEGGKTMYEIETTTGGHSRDLVVNAAGQIVETEEETAIDAVPAAVKTALEARGTVGKVETVTKGATVSYEAVVEKNGKKTEVAVNAAGKAIKP
jgi:uncharacterized membrane protein YkoI